MIKRRTTSIVRIHSLKIGWTEPVIIQSMTKVPTTNVQKCINQVKKLNQAGCKLVRIAVPTKADTEAFSKIVQKVNSPLIADIHFSPARAIEAIEAGAAKIRLNPGNIKKYEDILRIIDAAKAHTIAVRIGINEASIRDLKSPDIPPQRRNALMLREMKQYVRMFEKARFGNIVLSVKSADTVRTIQANRAIAKEFGYPIHLGLTHAGLPEDAKIPSAVGIGALLADGIGDTIRVSVAGNPLIGVQLAKEILYPLGLFQFDSPQLIVCPTCARCQVDVIKLAKQVKKAIAHIQKPLRIAVMGCIVNGPGEAADAELAVCATKGKAAIYKHGRKIKSVPEKSIIKTLLDELKRI